VFFIKRHFFLIRELLREVVMDITPTTPVAEGDRQGAKSS
jgi:hypothetical protein